MPAQPRQPEGAAIKGGLPPTIADLYDDPSLQADYPFRADIRASLENASVRPKTPAYQNMSIVISHAVSPPKGINPASTEKKMTSQLKDALELQGADPVTTRGAQSAAIAREGGGR